MAYVPKHTDEELDKFLKKVDDVESIVKGLRSTDLTVQSNAVQRADEFEAKEMKTVHDRTVINKSQDAEPPVVNPGITEPSMDKDQFMGVLEADAQRRAKERKERQKKAEIIKGKANTAFKDGKFETAVWLYTEAIDLTKDIPLLYTNRALTNLKLKRYEDAVKDCNMALRIDPKWIKAYVMKGNALKCEKKYDEAISSYKKSIGIDKTKDQLIKKYIHEASEEKRIENLEKMSKLSIEENSDQARRIAKLIRSIGTRVEIPHESIENMYRFYAGGFRLLAAQIVDEPTRTLFRTLGGFRILEAKPYLEDVLLMKAFSLGQQSDFACGFLIAVQAVCMECPENTVALFNQKLLPEILFNLLESSDKQVKRGAILSFFEFGVNDECINLVSRKFPPPKIVALLLNNDTMRLKLVPEAVSCLSRFANSKNFLKDIVQSFDELILQVFQKFLDEIAKNQRKELPQCMECLFKYTRNDFIIKMVTTNISFWESFLGCIDRCVHVMEPGEYRTELLSAMLDIAESLALHKSTGPMEVAPRLAQAVLPMIDDKTFELWLKSMVVITRCLEQTRETVKIFNTSAGSVFIRKIYKLMKNDHVTARTHSLKIICYLGQVDHTMLRNVPKFDKRYSIIRRILGLQEAEIDEINQGHAAILLGYLSNLPGSMDSIIESDQTCEVVRHLLNVVRDSKNTNTRFNCAVALGKMASNDNRILAELKRLDGINIISKYKFPV